MLSHLTEFDKFKIENFIDLVELTCTYKLDLFLQEDYFAIATQQGVMSIDASATSRPVVIRVTDPGQINQAFDSITYNKVEHEKHIKLKILIHLFDA